MYTAELQVYMLLIRVHWSWHSMLWKKTELPNHELFESLIISHQLFKEESVANRIDVCDSLPHQVCETVLGVCRKENIVLFK